MKPVTENRFEILLNYLKVRIFRIAFTATLVIILIELASYSFFYYRMPNLLLNKVDTRFFRRLYLTKILGTTAGQPPLEKELDIKYFPGDENPYYRTHLFPPHIFTGWIPKPNARYAHYGVWPYLISPQGFVQNDIKTQIYDVPKPKDKFRIIVLGGSTVFGQGVKYPNETIPGQVDATLNKHGNIEVINAGVGGFYSSQEYLYLVTELVHYQPDLVIIYDGWNDLHYPNAAIAAAKAKSNYWKPFYTDSHNQNQKIIDSAYHADGAVRLSIIKLSQWLLYSIECFFQGFAFPHWLDMKLNIVRHLEKLQPNISQVPTQFYKESAENYLTTHKLFISASKIYGFRVAHFLQPLMGIGKKTLNPAERVVFEKLNQELGIRSDFYNYVIPRLNVISKEEKSCYEDLTNAFEEIAPDQQTYVDSGHLNKLGNKIISERIVNKLKLCNFLPQDIKR